MKYTVILVSGLLLISVMPTLAYSPDHNVTKLMKATVPDDYTYTIEHGAEIVKVDYDDNYVVYWEPEGFDPKTDLTLVSLHGHESWAVTDFRTWYPELAERHYAYIGIQWWFGDGSEVNHYYKNKKITKIIRHRLRAVGTKHGRVIFQGFSMGSARSYGVTLLDQAYDRPYFGVTISNAGAWEDNYAMYKKVLNGEYGAHPLSDTKFIFYCAEQDTAHPTSCEDFDHTESVITSLGAKVKLFIRDADGSHGSFMLDEANRDRALDKAESLIH